MDVKRLSGDSFILSISPSEAKDISELVDHFTSWDLIASSENREPMMFMLQFGRDCSHAIENFPTLHFPIETGQVELSRVQVMVLAHFLKACVEADGQRMTWMRRNLFKLTYKTLLNRVA